MKTRCESSSTKALRRPKRADAHKYARKNQVRLCECTYTSRGATDLSKPAL
jgi:hypothetical protein